VIGNSAAGTAGSAGSTMAITAAIAPCRTRLATLAICVLVHRPAGAVKEREAVSDQRSVKVREPREPSTLDPKPMANGDGEACSASRLRLFLAIC
jgi:hypothetical protein